MGIAMAAVFNVQPGVGNDNNGMFYVPGGGGTDYSKQASPQYALTGLTSSGAGSTLLSAAAATDMVNNGANLISGTNGVVGVFQIVSVVAGVSITFDRAVTTGVGASIVLNIGGTANTISAAKAASTFGNTINFKGTYTASTALTISTNNNFDTPFTIAGYGTTPGDGVHATWTTSTNSINLLDLSSSTNTQFKSITFTNTAGTKGTGATGNGITAVSANAGNAIVSNCLFDGFNVGIGADWSASTFTIVNLQLDCVEVKNSVSHGVITTASTLSSGCWFHNNGADGFRLATFGNNGAYNYTTAFFHCVFYANTGSGFLNLSDQVPITTVGGNAMIGLFNCNFVSNGGDGANSPANQTGQSTVWNCIFWGNTGFGYNSHTSNALVNSIPRCNAFGSNNAGGGSVDRQNFPVGPGDITLTSDPFTNKAAGDFSLNSTAGGGAACKGTGFGAFPFGTGHIDIGAAQSSGTTTVTGILTHGGMSGGMRA